MPKRAKAFIFDLDGVITDTAKFHYLAWKQLAEELDISINQSFNEHLKGVSRLDSLELILSYGNRQDVYTDAEKIELAAKKNEYYKKYIETITEKDVLPGITELLQSIQAHSLQIALASSSKNAGAVMERLGIQSYFDYIVDAAAVKKGKPNPEIFLRAAEALQVPCEACIGVEDALAGVEAIQAAGMFAVGVGISEGKADYVVSSTIDLKFSDIMKQFVDKV